MNSIKSSNNIIIPHDEMFPDAGSANMMMELDEV